MSMQTVMNHQLTEMIDDLLKVRQNPDTGLYEVVLAGWGIHQLADEADAIAARDVLEEAVTETVTTIANGWWEGK